MRVKELTCPRSSGVTPTHMQPEPEGSPRAGGRDSAPPAQDAPTSSLPCRVDLERDLEVVRLAV